MRDLRHDNLNPFVGACVEPPNIIIITEYCSRGSLRDILENEDVKLDNMFNASIIGDIVRKDPTDSGKKTMWPTCRESQPHDKPNKTAHRLMPNSDVMDFYSYNMCNGFQKFIWCTAFDVLCTNLSSLYLKE
ncbi:Resact receptor [Araneus ventricosus]|uniref:Resact receptor n=1 Tax=Araneus ventricosus TaxID=182803 RepID=A0A4Y2I4N1_ARAVE|nr:Resact receptor [Araneus ventricosus]